MPMKYSSFNQRDTGERALVILTFVILGACYLPPWHVWLGVDRVLSVRLGWLAVGVLFAGASLTARRLPWHGVRGLYAATAMLCIPALFPHHIASVWLTLCRLVLLTMAVMLTGLLAGQSRSSRFERVAALSLLASGVVVAAWTLAAFWFPDPYYQMYWIPAASRVPGLLGQANVTGSFLATSVVLGLWQWLRSGKRHPFVWLSGLAGLMAAIHVTQSTVAILGVVFGFLLLYLAFGRGQVMAFTLAALVLLAGWMVTLWGPEMGIVQREYEASWTLRLQMIRASLALAAVRPWLGWGYGTFSDALTHLGELQLKPFSAVGHPHNELLYWLVEGGLVAASGIVLIALWGLRLMIRAFPGRQASERALRVGDGWGWCVCMIPVIIHMQTEYPLYQSALHWLVLVLCAGLAMSHLREQDLASMNAVPVCPSNAWRPWWGGLFRCGGFVIGGIVVWLTLTGSAVDVQIARLHLWIHQTSIQPLLSARRLNPWVDQPEARYIQSVKVMDMYDQTGDRRLLPVADRWMRASLRERPDPNGYGYLMALWQSAGDTVQVDQLQQEMSRRIRYAPVSLGPSVGAGNISSNKLASGLPAAVSVDD